MAASSDLFKKSHLQQPSRLQQKQQSKSCFSNLLCKSLIIILVLLVVPLFPSQAPDFIKKSISSNLWELLHLLVIGVAVSYGLFCRKPVQIEVENQTRNDGSHAYLSGVMNVSSFFDDGFENLCISDEKKNVENWDSLYMKNESMSKESSSNGDCKKVRSFAFGNGIKNICETDPENASQIWNSQYFQGETLVVVDNGNCVLDEHKPLGLPVRSLRSSINDTEKPEFNAISGSSSRLKGSFGNSSKAKVEKFRGPVPINLEKKFEEVAGPYTIPWQLRSGKLEMREEVSNVEAPLHHRPHSVGDSEFQGLKSRSFRHPISSGTSSLSPELSNQNTQYLESEKDLKGSLGAISQANAASVNGGATYSTKARGFSVGSSRELDRQRTPKDYFNEFSLSSMQDMLDREKKSSDSMNSNAKPSKLAKILAKGRSVRTIRSAVFASDEMNMKENYSNDIDDKVGAMHDQFEAPVLEKVKGGETKDPPIHIQKQNSNKVHPEPKEMVSEYHNDEIQDFTDSASLSAKDSELESESEDFQESSDDKEAEPYHLDNAEPEGSEVDRKADEFIAKFREQMRLQKIASVKRYSCQA